MTAIWVLLSANLTCMWALAYVGMSANARAKAAEAKVLWLRDRLNDEYAAGWRDCWDCCGLSS